MFNKNGEVIGIVSSILSQSGGFEGVGFAASINVAKELLINQKPIWIDIDPYFVAGVLAQALNIPQEAGILIQRVAQNSPGHHLGLKPSTTPAKMSTDITTSETKTNVRTAPRRSPSDPFAL